MIELKQVTKQYRQTAVLNNITLSIDEPGIYCLLGRNGAGKPPCSNPSPDIKTSQRALSKLTAGPSPHPLCLRESATLKTSRSILTSRYAGFCRPHLR